MARVRAVRKKKGGKIKAGKGRNTMPTGYEGLLKKNVKGTIMRSARKRKGKGTRGKKVRYMK